MTDDAPKLPSAPRPAVFKRVVSNPHDPPRPFNTIGWARQGSDTVLEFGCFDLVELNDATRDPKAALPLYLHTRLTAAPHHVLACLSHLVAACRGLEHDGFLRPADVTAALGQPADAKT